MDLKPNRKSGWPGGQASTPPRPLDHRPPGNACVQQSAQQLEASGSPGLRFSLAVGAQSCQHRARESPQPRLALGVWGAVLQSK